MASPTTRLVFALFALLTVSHFDAAAQPPVTFESLREAAADARTWPASLQEQRAQYARTLSAKWLKHLVADKLATNPGRNVDWALLRVLRENTKRNGTNLFQILPEITSDLRAATREDPAYLEAHVALALISYETGQRSLAVAHAEFVRHAAGDGAARAAEDERRLSGALAFEASVPLAWAYRELGEWEHGLAVVAWAEEYRRSRNLQPWEPLNLIKGLLLAGAGRGAEALRVGRSLQLRVLNTMMVAHATYTLTPRVSIYAQDWVHSQVYLGEGDFRLAIRTSARDDLEHRKQWLLMPYYEQYWNDMGLLFELKDEPVAASEWYAQMGRMRYDWSLFFDRGGARSTTPLIGGLPRPGVIYYQTEQQDYLWGSPFAYAADQYRRLEASSDRQDADAVATKQRLLAVVRSLEARHIEPGFCHAIRGGIAFLDGDFHAAENEFTCALDRFAERGGEDPKTRVLLGLTKYGLGKDDEAHRLLANESRDATAIQGLGVILARRGEFDQALTCLNRALTLEPRSLATRFNRGMLFYERGHYDEALEDFRLALELEPANREIGRWIEVCGVLAEEPESGLDFFRRGQVYFEIGEYVMAREDLLRAYEMDPQLSQDIAPWLQRVATRLRSTPAAAAAAQAARSPEDGAD